MEVILNQDVEKVGRLGEVVKVKDGFARNFLFPKKLASLATAANLRKIETQKKKKLAEYEQEKQAALAMAEKLSKVSCTVNVEVNDLEKLYGAVTEAEILKALEVEGQKIDKRLLVIEKPIDELGIFEIGVKLHPDVTAKIRLWVTKK